MPVRLLIAGRPGSGKTTAVSRLAAIGAGALVAFGLPPVFVYLEERELFHPRGHAPR